MSDVYLFDKLSVVGSFPLIRAIVFKAVVPIISIYTIIGTRRGAASCIAGGHIFPVVLTAKKRSHVAVQVLLARWES